VSRALIDEEGLSALSMREVARRAGISHQAPYNHFPDREAILGALAEEGFARLGDTLRRALAAVPEQVPAKLRAGIKAYVEFACQYPGHFRLMFRPELVDLDNCPGAQAEGTRTFELFTRVIHDGVLAGLPAEPSEDALVALGWSVSHGLACLILDGPLTRKLPGADRAVIIEGVCHAFEAMLTARMQTAAGVAAQPASKPRKKRS
jgi:AcrR family transcriptional regulator